MLRITTSREECDIAVDIPTWQAKAPQVIRKTTKRSTIKSRNCQRISKEGQGRWTLIHWIRTESGRILRNPVASTRAPFYKRAISKRVIAQKTITHVFGNKYWCNAQCLLVKSKNMHQNRDWRRILPFTVNDSPFQCCMGYVAWPSMINNQHIACL